DYRTAAFRAATYLINMGHRDIAYIGNHSETLQDFNLLTFSGFQKATSQNNISLGTNRIQLEAHDEDSLQECINKALNGPSRPTALFCTTDYYAILAIRYLHSQGINVPDDISIISIDNLPISKFMTPSLTTVRIDREKIGTRGFELIQKLINQEECESIVIDSYDVIVRESVARIDSGGNTVAS
ncbi:MAG: LacI family transcriptional regulator, partial [Clostridiaceae bacterium]|nr:LacI family transcriptional regulator [Clostridiaceae bacterium]